MDNNRKFVTKFVSSVFMMLLVVAAFMAGSRQAAAQACAAQNWGASTPNIWAAGGSIKVMLNNDASNRPTIPVFEYDGNFNPWGYPAHPQTIAQLNDVYSCPSGTPVITVAGAGRETISFQVFISAPASTALTNVSVAVSALTGAGTITSDNTGSSNVTRYLEGYVPYSGVDPNTPPQLQANGQMPDPLIPFYDPYDSGNPAVGTPFNVQSKTTQGVWVNIAIPASQTVGAYTGTVTVSGNGIGSVSIPVNLTVWNGNLPTFDAGSVNATYADMLKSWLPFYEGSFNTGEGLTCGGPGCPTGQALMAKYQIMGHAYDIDVQDEGYSGSGLRPALNGCYPSYGSCTSFTTDGHTSAIDWTAYDAYIGPSLTPGGLFSDGTAERVIDSPLSTEGAGAWVQGGWNWTDQNGNAPVPPAGLMQLVTNYSTQISQHFSANHTSKGWVIPELISYTFDETYNNGHGKDLGGNPLIYQIISSYNQAINSSNSALSSTWAASTAPIHNFLTDEPACQEDGDNPQYTNAVCADHIDLSYPGGTNATPGYTNSWVITWSSNPSIYMPGRPGPALNYGTNPTIIAGTGYQFTYDLTNGVPALSTAPAPIEHWFYQGGDPFNVGDNIGATGVGQRINYWIAYKYSLDQTVGSAGDPSPAVPAPSGVWIWVGNFWGGYGGTSSPSNCGNTNAPSPFVSAATGGDGVLFYPGNEVGCYYTTNTVGATILTKSAAVNTGCTSNGYSVCNGISGPVASMRMEAMRRGYEDYEYMYLLGKQSGRAAPLAIINSLGVANMTAGGLGTTSWNALDWENTDGPWYAMGVEPQTSAYSGYCTDSTPGIGGLANGLPNGSTGAASTGSNFNYGPCPGEWTNNPYRIEAARIQLAQQLGFAPAGTPAATPTFSPGAGTYTSTQSVTISDSTSGATIYYTTNGTTPTTSSSVYSSPISVATSESLKAIATASGYTTSAVGSAAYTINTSTVATPTFSPGAGTYTSTQSVTISDSTSGATIHYTTDGSTPTASSTTYSSPISVSASETIKALGVKSGYTNSAIGSAAYTIQVATPTFSPGAGTYSSTQSVTISDSTSGATIHYTTDGSTPTASSTTYSSPISVSVSETVKALGVKSGLTNSAIGSATYTITGGGSLPNGWTDLDIGSPSIAGSASYSGTTFTVKGSGADIWGTSDQFNYAYEAANGNVTLTARVATQTNTDGWAKSGVMIRDTTAAGAAYVLVAVTPGNGITLQYRSSTGGSANQAAITAGLVAPYWVRLVRSGSTFTAYTSSNGTTWTTLGSTTATIGTNALGGLAVTSHAAGTLNTSTFDNVTLGTGGGSPNITTIAGVQGSTTNPTSGTVAHGNTIGAPYGVAIAPVIGGAGGDVYFDNSNNYGVYVIYQGGAAAKAILVAGGTASPVVGDVYTINLGLNETGPYQPRGLAVDSYGNLLIADQAYSRVYMLYAGTVTGQGTNPADALIIADPATWEVPGYGLHTGYLYHMADGSNVVGAAPTNPSPKDVWVDSKENIFFTDSAGSGVVEVIYNITGSSANTILTAEGYTSLKQGYTYIVAGGLSTSTYPNDKDSGSSVAYNGSTSASNTAINNPQGIYGDSAGNLIFADYTSNKIKKLSGTTAVLSTIGGPAAGTATTVGHGGDGGAATSAQMNGPIGVVLDASGNAYFADSANSSVRMINTSGTISTVAGTSGTSGTYTGEGGPATSAVMNTTYFLSIDGSGNIDIADNGNDLIHVF